MGCACKKNVQKIVQYDRQLGKKNGDIITETIIEEINEESNECKTWYDKFLDFIINLLKAFGMILLAIIAFGIVIIWFTIWFITALIRRFLLKKDTKINSPFFEYDKIKERIKKHNKKMSELVESKKETEENKEIKI